MDLEESIFVSSSLMALLWTSPVMALVVHCSNSVVPAVWMTTSQSGLLGAALSSILMAYAGTTGSSLNPSIFSQQTQPMALGPFILLLRINVSFKTRRGSFG